MSIELKEDEKALADEVRGAVNKLTEFFQSGKMDGDIDTIIASAGETAHKLHKALKERGVEPQHHGYMIENRGMPSDHEEFYMHFHPLEDLVAFLDDPHANDDPTDQTIGSEFSVKIYTRRWGHDDNYTFKRTKSGWIINNLNIGGECNKGGYPSLFQNFRQDNVQYPANLDGWLEYLWEKAASEGLSENQLQAALDALAAWVSTVERNTPNIEPLGRFA